jgi:hypothetical protein
MSDSDMPVTKGEEEEFARVVGEFKEKALQPAVQAWIAKSGGRITEGVALIAGLADALAEALACLPNAEERREHTIFTLDQVARKVEDLHAQVTIRLVGDAIWPRSIPTTRGMRWPPKLWTN